MVIVQDLQNVFVDGVNAGAVVDVLRNMPGMALDVQSALEIWKKGQENPEDRHREKIVVARLVTLSKEFNEALAQANQLARTADTLGISQTLQLSDFSGPLAGRTPKDAIALLAFVDAVDQLADQRAEQDGPTYRESIEAFAIAANSK
jgi:hypothetical protein